MRTSHYGKKNLNNNKSAPQCHVDVTVSHSPPRKTQWEYKNQETKEKSIQKIISLLQTISETDSSIKDLMQNAFDMSESVSKTQPRSTQYIENYANVRQSTETLGGKTETRHERGVRGEKGGDLKKRDMRRDTVDSAPQELLFSPVPSILSPLRTRTIVEMTGSPVRTRSVALTSHDARTVSMSQNSLSVRASQDPHSFAVSQQPSSFAVSQEPPSFAVSQQPPSFAVSQETGENSLSPKERSKEEAIFLLNAMLAETEKKYFDASRKKSHQEKILRALSKLNERDGIKLLQALNIDAKMFADMALEDAKEDNFSFSSLSSLSSLTSLHSSDIPVKRVQSANGHSSQIQKSIGEKSLRTATNATVSKKNTTGRHTNASAANSNVSAANSRVSAKSANASANVNARDANSSRNETARSANKATTSSANTREHQNFSGVPTISIEKSLENENFNSRIMEWNDFFDGAEGNVSRLQGANNATMEGTANFPGAKDANNLEEHQEYLPDGVSSRIFSSVVSACENSSKKEKLDSQAIFDEIKSLKKMMQKNYDDLSKMHQKIETSSSVASPSLASQTVHKSVESSRMEEQINQIITQRLRDIFPLLPPSSPLLTSPLSPSPLPVSPLLSSPVSHHHYYNPVDQRIFYGVHDDVIKSLNSNVMSPRNSADSTPRVSQGIKNYEIHQFTPQFAGDATRETPRNSQPQSSADVVSLNSTHYRKTQPSNTQNNISLVSGKVRHSGKFSSQETQAETHAEEYNGDAGRQSAEVYLADSGRQSADLGQRISNRSKKSGENNAGAMVPVGKNEYEIVGFGDQETGETKRTKSTSKIQRGIESLMPRQFYDLNSLGERKKKSSTGKRISSSSNATGMHEVYNILPSTLSPYVSPLSSPISPTSPQPSPLSSPSLPPSYASLPPSHSESYETKVKQSQASPETRISPFLPSPPLSSVHLSSPPLSSPLLSSPLQSQAPILQIVPVTSSNLRITPFVQQPSVMSRVSQQRENSRLRLEDGRENDGRKGESALVESKNPYQQYQEQQLVRLERDLLGRGAEREQREEREEREVREKREEREEREEKRREERRGGERRAGRKEQWRLEDKRGSLDSNDEGWIVPLRGNDNRREERRGEEGRGEERRGGERRGEERRLVERRRGSGTENGEKSLFNETSPSVRISCWNSEEGEWETENGSSSSLLSPPPPSSLPSPPIYLPLPSPLSPSTSSLAPEKRKQQQIHVYLESPTNVRVMSGNTELYKAEFRA